MDHTHTHADTHTDADVTAFWDDRYGASDRLWSGRANPRLVETVDGTDGRSGLAPGRALDLGCGEGGDTVWLASRGWDVTAVDVSGVALARTRAAADDAGVGDRVATARYDLAVDRPAGEWDLVSAQFFQSPLELPRAAILRAVAGDIVPGGLLLVVEHGSAPSWSGHAHEHFATPDELHADLALDPEVWTTVRRDAPEREVTGPDGERATILDTVVALRRTR